MKRLPLKSMKLIRKAVSRSNIIANLAAIKLIVGLRNPGSAYAQTRHNVGAWFVEALAHLEKSSFKSDKKLRGDIATIQLGELSCLLFMPLSFMNINGECVRAMCQFYRILPHELLVVHDDLDLSVGCVRLKTGGGHGGHNGLRDLIAQIGSQEFHRLRMGIGHPGHRELVSDYVLSKPSVADRQRVVEAIDRALSVMPLIVSGQIARAMNQLNTDLKL